MASEKLLPCKCGYEGALMGTDNGAFFIFTCPRCNSSVEAFSIRSLGENWNKKQAAPAAQKCEAPSCGCADAYCKAWDDEKPVAPEVE